MTLIRLAGIVGLVTLCTFYPFLPGEYDSLAVPIIVLVLQVVLAGPMTEFSRNRAIASSAALITAPRLEVLSV